MTPGRAGAHQVQRGAVVEHAAGDHRDVELGDEGLQVERLAVAAPTRSAEMIVPWMTSRSMPAATSAGVSACGVLRADPHRGGHPGVADARHRGAEQVGIQRRGVQLLQQPDRRRRLGLLLGGLDDLGDLGLDVGVPADQALAVEHTETAEPAQLDRELRRHQRVGGVRDDRDLEPVGVELPGRRHVLRRAGAPRRHDVDVVEFVGAAGGSAHADLNHVTHERHLVLSRRRLTPHAAHVV